MTYASLELELQIDETAMTPIVRRKDPRALMAERLPEMFQPFCTWLTARPAPGQTIQPRSPTSFIWEALLWMVSGISLAAVAVGGDFGFVVTVVMIGGGWLATSSGLGLFQVVVFHHCSHGTVLSSRQANRRLGRVISALLLFKRFDDYQREHMLHHSANKLLTEEDEFTGFIFGLCRLEPGVPKDVLWRRIICNLVSPIFHGRFLLRRISSSLLSGDRQHDRVGWAFWIGGAVISLATGTFTEYVVAWIIPVTVLLQVATVFRILCEHRFPDAALIHARGKAFLCAATNGVFPGLPPPAPDQSWLAGLSSWCRWWVVMLTCALFTRVFVLVGDAPCHDYHHRRPASRKWTVYMQARQQDVDAGSPGFPSNYTESWGLLRAIDQNLGTLAETPPGIVA